MIDGKINENKLTSRREKGETMGNQIYIKGTKMSIINGSVDGVRRYGVATIEGRTYTKIHGLRITNNEGLHEIGLQHGIAYVDLERIFSVARTVAVDDADLEPSGIKYENMFNTFLIDRFMTGHFGPNDSGYLRTVPRVCGYSGEDTFIYKSAEYVIKKVVGEGEGVDGLRNHVSNYIDSRYLGKFFRCNEDGLFYCSDNFESTTANGYIYELSNYELQFHSCSRCEERYHRNNLTQTEFGGLICSDCDYDIPTGIHSYGYKPKLMCWDVVNGSIIKAPLRADKDLLGFELEVQFKEGLSRFDQRQIVKKIEDTLEGGFLFCVNDNSINGNGRSGVEIVSHPMTYDFFTSYGFDELFKLRGLILGW